MPTAAIPLATCEGERATFKVHPSMQQGWEWLRVAEPREHKHKSGCRKGGKNLPHQSTLLHTGSQSLPAGTWLGRVGVPHGAEVLVLGCAAVMAVTGAAPTDRL